MFDLSWSHILIVLVVALVVVGPKDLPKLMHTAGRWVAKARGMVDQLRKGFDEMSRQAELDELRAEIDALRRERPFEDVERALRDPALPPPEAAKAEANAPLETSHEESHGAAPALVLPGAEPPPP